MYVFWGLFRHQKDPKTTDFEYFIFDLYRDVMARSCSVASPLRDAQP